MTETIMFDPKTGEVLGRTYSTYDAVLPAGCEPPIIPDGAVILQVEDAPEGPTYVDVEKGEIVYDQATADSAEKVALEDQKVSLQAALAEVDAKLDAIDAAVAVDGGVAEPVDERPPAKLTLFQRAMSFLKGG